MWAALAAGLLLALPAAGGAAWLVPVGAPDALGAAARALALRADAAPAQVAQALANLDTARALEAVATDGGDPLALGVRVAEVASRAQAASLGFAWAPVAPPVHATPSEAAFALLAHAGVAPTPEERADILALDAWGAAPALARLLDAFAAYQAATRQAFAHADLALLGPWLDAARDPARAADLLQLAPGEALRRAGVDLGGVFAARAALLEAGLGLRLVTPPVQPPLGGVRVAPVFALGLNTLRSDTYDKDFALVVDLGGHDRYLNNAGGNGLDGGQCGLQVGYAAALFDFGGDDRYPALRNCGSNGGARLGSGLLVDVGGDDLYLGMMEGTNGGGFSGTGLLLDTSGHDTYWSDGCGTNGGGALGAGMLIDLGASNDQYTGMMLGVNGGDEAGGAGFLLDAGGDDRYFAGPMGGNGGAFSGNGFLVDLAGNDVYEAEWSAVNGGGEGVGVGFLYDPTGHDAYISHPAPGGDMSCLQVPGMAGSCGANGGAFLRGVGVLVDGGGDDRYQAGDKGVNGGGYQGGIGLLVDADGDDSYLGGADGANGGTAGPCPVPGPACVPVPVPLGALLDLTGRDRFEDAAGLCANPAPCTLVPKGFSGALVDG